MPVLKGQKSLKPPESGLNDIKYIAEGVGVIIIAAYIFYENIFMSVLLIPYVAVHIKESRRIAETKKKRILTKQFKDGIMAVSFALNVGYSIENAFSQAIDELILLYGSEADIVMKFENIVVRINQNENIEDILNDFAKECKIEDIMYFAEVFRYAKRSGGDLISIIRNTADIIQQKTEVAAEVETIVSGKRMEQKVMSAIPALIILYLKVTAREFVEPLYGNLSGVLIMTCCLGVYLISNVWSKRIVNIEV